MSAFKLIALVVLVGAAVYAGYVVPIEGFEWHYFAAVFGIAVLAMLAFRRGKWKDLKV